MSVLGVIQAVGVLKDLLPAGSTIISLVEKFLSGKATKDELMAAADSEQLSAEVRLQLAQIALNGKEASHPSIFVAGWRPAVGWICAIILLFNFIIGPLVSVFGVMIPVLDASTMMPVLLGMLGVGGMRSFEKMKGVHRDNMKPRLEGLLMGWLTDFVKEKEGFRKEAYQDLVGVWTIGYGFTHGVKKGDTITKDEAEERLEDELQGYLEYVIYFMHQNNYDWNNNQVAALTSFIFNGGKGWLNQVTDGGKRDNETIGAKMRLYHNAGGRKIKGLVTRRNEEADHFMA